MWNHLSWWLKKYLYHELSHYSSFRNLMKQKDAFKWGVIMQLMYPKSLFSNINACRKLQMQKITDEKKEVITDKKLKSIKSDMKPTKYHKVMHTSFSFCTLWTGLNTRIYLLNNIFLSCIFLWHKILSIYCAKWKYGFSS